ncbi:MAG: AraC family transcriptional regulator [Oscillospiraceae bacterium]|nr:AraC family transcriptional regulator [Oscillospiraceae bacterium]
MLDYVAGQYSVSAIDTPSSGYALALSEKDDFLALSVRFTLDEVISVVLDMDGDLPEQIIGGKIADSLMESADRNLFDAAARLLAILDEPVQLAYMSRHIKREMSHNSSVRIIYMHSLSSF